MDGFDVRHDAAAQVFSVEIDGQRGVVDYILRDDVMTITHTRVPEAIGGRGVAAALVKAALDCARSNGWKVIPACSYAAAYIQRHSDYEVLLCDRQ